MNQNSKIDRRCKLTDDDVRLIFELHEERLALRERVKSLTVDAICEKFDIAHCYYYVLINGENRKEVTL
jgi:hypothetical protein